MTSAKPNHLKARRLLLDHLDLHPGRTVHADLDPLEAGIVGDAAHAGGGDSYHLGRDQIRARAGDDRYSVDESLRDRNGLDDYASALDIGYFRITTPRGSFDLYDLNAWLIGLCRAGDPDTKDLREVIYSPDGEVVKRWDDLGKRSTGDKSHTTHTHLSEYRDADGSRMVRLATRWLQHIGLIPEEDDMADREVVQALSALRATVEKLVAADASRDQLLLKAIRQTAQGGLERGEKLNDMAVVLTELSDELLTDPAALADPEKHPLVVALRYVLNNPAPTAVPSGTPSAAPAL